MGTIPLYSGNTPLEMAGPMYATTGKKMYHATIDPTIAITVYLVHMLQTIGSQFGPRNVSHGYTYSVIKAAFQRIQPKTAVNTPVPAHHCPPTMPLANTPSLLNAPTPKKKSSCAEHQLRVLCQHIVLSETYQRVIDGVDEPTPESALIKKLIILAEHVHLRIFVQQSRRHVLIEYTDHKRR